MKSFYYPKELQEIFESLCEKGIRPIIVGGFVRDFFLNFESKDIDIELYNIPSLEEVEKNLKQFGKVNSVGKSFGVVKLLYKGLDLDFSLPRVENKDAKGHKGFTITITASLTFKEAAHRRDFTINTIGYDILNKKILDPYNGIYDLQKRVLKAVDLQKFGEDPLRVLRAVYFTTKFDLHIQQDLFLLCQDMIDKDILNELPKERIFEELKKILLKTQKPSKAFVLLQKIHGFSFFTEFQTISHQKIQESLDRVDRSKKEITLLFALLIANFSKKEQSSFLLRITNNKTLIEKILHLNTIHFDLKVQSDYKIYKLAQEINIKYFCDYLLAYDPTKKEDIKRLQRRAEELQVLEKSLEPLVRGKDLISLGLKPSKEFSKILNLAYEKQIKNEFKTKTDAIEWIKDLIILS
jgi:tRNA nucleotidyltransferase (CCA-adding enzyme)